MDTCKIEPFMAATLMLQKRTLDRGDATRSFVHEKNNAIAVATCKLAPTREAASGYKSGMSSTPSSRPGKPKRSSSPTVGCASPAMQPKRALSTDRKRPINSSQRSSTSSTPSSRPSTPLTRPLAPSSGSCRSTTPVRDTVIESRDTTRSSVSSKTSDGLWPKVRNLSSSFQLEYVAIAVSKKEKVAGDSSNQTAKFSANGLVDRKRSPLRGRNTIDQSENSKPSDQYSNSKIIDHRWPAMLGGKLSGNALSKSADLTEKANRNNLPSRGVSPRRTASDGPARDSQKSLTEAARRLSLDGNAKVGRDMKSCVSSSQHSQRSLSATRYSRTPSLSGVHTSSQISERPLTGTRPSRVQTVSSSNTASPSSPARRFSRPSSPAPNIICPSSPSKAFSTSTSNRGALTPSRTRTSTPISQSVNASNHLNAASSNINYISDLRKGKKNANHVEDAHQLRILSNVIQQWRFVNAQADETMMIKKMIAENALRRMWSIISSLCESVIVKRVGLQYLQQEMKLDIILNEQLEYLELWPALEREHCISLSEAAEALRASTLRLPVTGGAKADMVDVRNSVSSAVDVMQAVGSSICHLMSKVEGRNSLLSELSAVAAKEKTMLDECRELLRSAATLQVQESSLITHRLRQQDAHKME